MSVDCNGIRCESWYMVLGVYHRWAAWRVPHTHWLVSAACQPAGTSWIWQVWLLLEVKVSFQTLRFYTYTYCILHIFTGSSLLWITESVSHPFLCSHSSVSVIIIIFVCFKNTVFCINLHRKGTVFHESRGKHFSDCGFNEGDTLGIMIDLPEKNPVSQFPPTYKDKVMLSALLCVTLVPWATLSLLLRYGFQILSNPVVGRK